MFKEYNSPEAVLQGMYSKMTFAVHAQSLD